MLSGFELYPRWVPLETQFKNSAFNELKFKLTGGNCYRSRGFERGQTEM